MGKIFKKKECYLIILCIILIICGQVLFDYKYITPMKEYDEVINTCYDINEKVDVDMFYGRRFSYDKDVKRWRYNI